MRKEHSNESPIHQILIITDTNLVTNELRKRLIRNSNDQIRIIAPKTVTIAQLGHQRETQFHVDLNQVTKLSDLIPGRTFDTLYLNLIHNVNLINPIISVVQASKIKRLILVLNSKESQNNAKIKRIIQIIKTSRLHYVIIRTAHLNKSHLLSYQVDKNAQPVNDSSVSADSVADLAFQSIEYPNLHVDADLGIAQLPYK